MRYCNRMVATLLVGFPMITGTIYAQNPFEKDVFVRGGPKWTVYDVPPGGASLTLNVRKGPLSDLTAPPITTSGVRIQDDTDGDLVIWKRQDPCTGDLHVYKIFGVSPGHEWVAITGSCSAASAKTPDQLGIIKRYNGGYFWTAYDPLNDLWTHVPLNADEYTVKVLNEY